MGTDGHFQASYRQFEPLLATSSTNCGLRQNECTIMILVGAIYYFLDIFTFIQLLFPAGNELLDLVDVNCAFAA